MCKEVGTACQKSEGKYTKPHPYIQYSSVKRCRDGALYIFTYTVCPHHPYLESYQLSDLNCMNNYMYEHICNESKILITILFNGMTMETIGWPLS